jgi:hypothetical protein
VAHLLPVESVALRAHLFGALTASIGLGLLYCIGRRHLELERAVCLLGVFCVAFSTLFWEQALIAEAYQLNGVLFLLRIPCACACACADADGRCQPCS